MSTKASYKAKSVETQSGTYLRVEIPSLRQRDIVAKFPEGKHEGYYDPEKGYDDFEVSFVDTENSNSFNVYARYGQVRIGAFGTVSDDEVEDFYNWLVGQFS